MTPMRDTIIKKLKTLKNITPSAEWKKSNRQLLMMAIKGGADSGAIEKTWTQEFFQFLFPLKVAKLILRPALTLAVLFILILGSGLSVSAAQMALPGDKLYSLKLATEKVQVALTFKKEDKAKVHLELAGKRINEVKKIKENPLPAGNKNQKINVAINNFKQEIATAQVKLENLNAESFKAAVVEVAKIVDKKTNEYHEVLLETTNDPEVSGEVALNLTEGLSMVEELSKKAKQIVAIALSAEGGSESEEVLPEQSLESATNRNTNPEETQNTTQNTNADGTSETNTNTLLGIEEATGANAPESTNDGSLPKKVYIKPVVPINTNTNTNTNTNAISEPEVIDESQLKVGIDLRQEPTQE